MNGKKLIFLTGISGSGKTTTINEFKKIDTYNTDIITSSTREYYSTTKFTNEKSILSSSKEDRISHQLNMMDYISNTLFKKIISSNKDYILIDRSYIDYAVYSYMEGAFDKDKLILLSKLFHNTYLARGYKILNILYLKRLNNVNTDDGFREERSEDYYLEYANLIKECILIQDHDENLSVSDSLNNISKPERLAKDILWEMDYNKKIYFYI